MKKCIVCEGKCGRTINNCKMFVLQKILDIVLMEMRVREEDPLFTFWVPGSTTKEPEVRSGVASGEILMLNANSWQKLDAKARFLQKCIDNLKEKENG